jgi:glucose/arabinose dehydrogenase
MVRRVGCSLVVLAALTLAACGGGSSPSPTPSPSPANAPPSFTSAGTASVTSGATGAVYSATASDPNNDPLTFSIAGGADAGAFQITSAGALSFRTPPDVNAPADSDRNNVYLVQLSVSDGQASATLNLAVTVVPGQAGFRVRRVATGFSQPLFVAPAPGSDRVFVVERTGRIRILDPASGAIAGTFLDVSTLISTDGERGLLGFATAPDFPTSHTFYIYMTNTQGAIEVRRYRTTALDPNIADPATGDVILTIPHPGFSNHNGGWIGFGPDNLLYVGTGDGGGAGDPNNNAQNTNSLLGKMLRIDPSGDDFPADNNRDYRIPAANPFAGGGGAPEVLAYGLRNPFRNGFDGSRLYIGDVGQGAVEEVDILLTNDAAVNFGWPVLEGTRAFRGGGAAGLTPPVAEYQHGSGAFEGNSITGGLVYRGPVTSLQGSYIFGDFVNPRIWSLPAASLNRGATQPSSSFVDRLSAFAPDAGAFTNIVAFGTDRSGNLYIVNFDGEIFVLERAP